MYKLPVTLMAGLLAIAVHGAAYPAESGDSTSSSQDSTPHNQAVPVTVTDPLEPASDRAASAASIKSNKPEDAKDNEVYQAKLKRCEGVSSPGNKKECADKAKKEHGQM